MHEAEGQHDDKMVDLRKRLAEVEVERGRAIDDLREMKRVADQANLRLSSAEMSNGKVADIFSELNSVVEALSRSNQELKVKEMAIGVLKVELDKAKRLEMKMEEDLCSAKSSETKALELLSESRKRAKELEVEVDKKKEHEVTIWDSFRKQMKQLEETRILLQESNLEIASLCGRLQASDRNQPDGEEEFAIKADLETLKFELHLAKEHLAHFENAEKDSELQAIGLLEEVRLLKNELKQASKAEENSKKALDDMALALKEVATETNQSKEKLIQTQEQLEHFKLEAEKLKEKIRSNEEEHKSLLNEAKKEADLYRNTVERLRLEAEESAVAWNLKETEFVNCIKRTEEEKETVLEDNAKLLESLMESEKTSKGAKQETQNLRDILKQALNEANVAKEAAGIARAENSQLKDLLVEKDDALHFITRENESLRLNEAAALENINELRKMLSEATSKAGKIENGKDHEHRRPPTPTPHPPSTTPTGQKETKHTRRLSLSLKELIIPNKQKEPSDQENHNEEEDEEAMDLLRGSIFDMDSPVAVSTRHKKSNSSFTGFEGEMPVTAEEFDQLVAAHSDDMDHERNYGKKRAFLRRFGDIITRRSFHHGRKEALTPVGGETQKKELPLHALE